MLGSEPDLQMHVKNLRGSQPPPPPKKNWGAKTAYRYFVTVVISTKLGLSQMTKHKQELFPTFRKRSP